MARSRNSSAAPKLPDADGHFGPYGGRYVAETLMPAILEAVRAYATVGEISDRLRVAWGEHRELITV